MGIAEVMFDTAVLRSGYVLQDQAEFSKRILGMLYSNLDIDPDAPVSIFHPFSNEEPNCTVHVWFRFSPIQTFALKVSTFHSLVEHHRSYLSVLMQIYRCDLSDKD